MNWLSSLFSNPKVKAALWALILAIISAGGATIATNLAQPAPVVNTTHTTEVNVIPIEPNDPMFLGTQAGGGANPKHGLHLWLRSHLAVKVMERDGIKFGEAWKKTSKLTSDDYQGASVEASRQMGDPVGQLGDGTLLQKFLDFLRSPEGQALLKLLLTLLLGMV